VQASAHTRPRWSPPRWCWPMAWICSSHEHRHRPDLMFSMKISSMSVCLWFCVRRELRLPPSLYVVQSPFLPFHRVFLLLISLSLSLSLPISASSPRACDPFVVQLSSAVVDRINASIWNCLVQTGTEGERITASMVGQRTSQMKCEPHRKPSEVHTFPSNTPHPTQLCTLVCFVVLVVMSRIASSWCRPLCGLDMLVGMSLF
jgi:hypothetical protein